jgi:hypothetical protein
MKMVHFNQNKSASTCKPFFPIYSPYSIFRFYLVLFKLNCISRLLFLNIICCCRDNAAMVILTWEQIRSSSLFRSVEEAKGVHCIYINSRFNQRVGVLKISRLIHVNYIFLNSKRILNHTRINDIYAKASYLPREETNKSSDFCNNHVHIHVVYVHMLNISQ